MAGESRVKDVHAEPRAKQRAAGGTRDGGAIAGGTRDGGGLADGRREAGGLAGGGLDRRGFVKLAGTAGAGLALSPLFAACGSGSGGSGSTIKIGYVSPETGPLAGFGEADKFVIGALKKKLADGIDVGGDKRSIEVLVRDSQSNSNRAASVTNDLILNDNVNLVLVEGTPDNTNPVADACEANGTPCISSVAPWQSYFLGRKGDPAKPFKWTYHFFWGLEDLIAVYSEIWPAIPTNKKMGVLWPNDPDGLAFADPKNGFTPPLKQQGFTIVDGGRFNDGTDDFSAAISKFKTAGVELISGVAVPPDFATFWSQAAQQGLHPKIATIAKAILFPSAVDALGDRANGLATEVWWSNKHPFKSSLTGESAADLAAAYESSTKKLWTQPVGFVHALFEVAVDVFKRAKDVGDPKSVADAVKATNLDTVVGKIGWSAGADQNPVANVSKTKLVGGQWVKGTKYPHELSIVTNKQLPDVPIGGKLAALGAA
jgi:branched-chain amino acid transport system substrate-binding protein